MRNTLTDSQVAALCQIDACTLANVIESFHVRLRNEGFSDSSIQSVFPGLGPVAGYATTIKIKAGSPPMGGADAYVERAEWLDYVASLPTPRFLAVQDVSERPGKGALLGAVHANIVKALGCVGAATNGAVRDLGALEALKFPVFSGTISVSHAYVHIVEIGGAIELGGLKIRSGDLLHGDRHGIQTIPVEIAADIPAAAQRLAVREKAIIDLCHSQGFSLEKLRALLDATRT